MARALTLGLEYAPAPPFDCGHPDIADPDTLAMVRAVMADASADRLADAKAAAALMEG